MYLGTFFIEPSDHLKYKYKYEGLLYNSTAMRPFPSPVTASTSPQTISDTRVFGGVLLLPHSYYYVECSINWRKRARVCVCACVFVGVAS